MYAECARHIEDSAHLARLLLDLYEETARLTELVGNVDMTRFEGLRTELLEMASNELQSAVQRNVLTGW